MTGRTDDACGDLACRALAAGGDLGERLQAGKAVAFRQPGHVGDHASAAGLDPAVVGTEGLGCGVGLDGRIVQKEDGVVVHGEAVRLQAEDVIGSLVRIACAVSR